MNTTVPIQKSMRFFIRMLPVFFALVKPASTIAKPACIQKTNAAPIRNQTPKITPLISSVIVMSSLSFFILLKVKFIKNRDTSPISTASWFSKMSPFYYYVKLNHIYRSKQLPVSFGPETTRIKPRKLNRRMMALATSLCRQSSQAHQPEYEEHP